MPTLAEELLNLQAGFISGVSPEVMDSLVDATRDLLSRAIAEHALGIGDTFPEFALPNVLRREVTSEELFQRGTLVINFYQGEFCPFCNEEVSTYQQVLPEIKSLGAYLVSVAPDSPDHMWTHRERRKLRSEVLCDQGNRVARQLGIVFELNDSLVEVYRDFGLNLSRASQRRKRWELTLPATYIVRSDRSIAHCFIDADYKQRMEPAQVVRFLRLMQS